MARGRRSKETSNDGEFAGQVLVSDNFIVQTSERLGRAVLEMKPVGWVGPGFEISGSRIEELRELLDKVENLPEQEETAPDEQAPTEKAAEAK